MTSSLLSYISITFFLVITPGVTTAVVIHHTLRHGHRAGAAAALGAACGNTTYALAAGLGLAMLVHRWPQVLSMLRVGGAVYLCWVGIRGIRRAWIGSQPAALGRSDQPVDHGPALRDGLTVTLLNPGVATFYLAVVPGFLGSSAGFASFAPLAAIHIVMAWSCHMTWALALDSLRTRLAGPSLFRTLDAAAGLALLILGLRMLV